MPRDEWGNLKRREFARKSFRSGNYDMADLSPAGRTATKKRKRRQRRAASPIALPAPKQLNPCRCGSAATTRQVQPMNGGGFHVRLSCAGCGKFIKWLSHKEAGL